MEKHVGKSFYDDKVVLPSAVSLEVSTKHT